jgi:peptidoglycan/LPS O-acetylase OafA/YrhL
MVEIKSHTALRGIAALIVVMYHFRSTLPPSLNPDQFTQFFAKGYLWVDCFFILSGFILCYVYGTRPAETREQRERFFLARFARIFPLHLATLLVLVAFQFASQRFSNHPLAIGGWNTFWLNFLDIHAWGMLDSFDWNFPSWSISVEFAAYFLFPFICSNLLRRPLTTKSVLALTVPLGMMVGRDHWERTALLHGLPMFLLGVLVFQIRGLLPSRPAALQIMTIAALIASLHFGVPNFIIEVIFAVLIWLTWTDAGAARIFDVPPLKMLGDWSFSIYMLHIPIRLIFGFLLAGKVAPVAEFLIFLTMTIIAGALSYRCFEMPARRILLQQRVAVPA